jgi:hypothetical protein
MPHGPRPYDPRDYEASSVKLDRFLEAARDQIGDKYRFGAEASEDDANPTAFDSSELVEWAAHRAGFHDMPDGSWNQYRFLHEAGASVPVEEALQTKGALVFGFSSDPLESADRPTRAYVGISLGNGKILDISERSGEVREMDPGTFYSYGAKIPDFHAPDDEITPDPGYPVPDPYGGDPLGVSDRHVTDDPLGPFPTPHTDPLDPVGAGDHVDPVDPSAPAGQYGPDGGVPHDDLPAPEPHVAYEGPPEPNVAYPDEPRPDDQVGWPDDDGGPTAQAEPAATYSDSDSYSDSYADSYTDLSADV